jgi:hypothetical protein
LEADAAIAPLKWLEQRTESPVEARVLDDYDVYDDAPPHELETSHVYQELDTTGPDEKWMHTKPAIATSDISYVDAGARTPYAAKSGNSQPRSAKQSLIDLHYAYIQSTVPPGSTTTSPATSPRPIPARPVRNESSSYLSDILSFVRRRGKSFSQLPNSLPAGHVGMDAARDNTIPSLEEPERAGFRSRSSTRSDVQPIDVPPRSAVSDNSRNPSTAVYPRGASTIFSDSPPRGSRSQGHSDSPPQRGTRSQGSPWAKPHIDGSPSSSPALTSRDRRYGLGLTAWTEEQDTSLKNVGGWTSPSPYGYSESAPAGPGVLNTQGRVLPFDGQVRRRERTHTASRPNSQPVEIHEHSSSDSDENMSASWPVPSSPSAQIPRLESRNYQTLGSPRPNPPYPLGQGLMPRAHRRSRSDMSEEIRRSHGKNHAQRSSVSLTETKVKADSEDKHSLVIDTEHVEFPLFDE